MERRDNSMPIKNKKFKLVVSETFKQMKKFHVPGTAIGIIHKDKEYCTGLGITDIENPLPVTENTLFQIGSISKTFLATAVMRLVEKKKINLDIPIIKYLPDLKLSNKETTKKVTMRHLLTHTGGWFGDYFNDFGKNDDALNKMVIKMSELPQCSRFGSIFSYNNSGFYLAGRVLEIVSNKPYETAIKDLVLDPLNMKMSFFFTDDVMTHRFVVGHNVIKNKAKVAKPWAMGRSIAPAGGVISTVKDLFKYARFYMGNGKTPNGKKFLSKTSMTLLKKPLLNASSEKKIALSWFIKEFNGKKGISHTGATTGQTASLQIIPSEKFAAIILTNSSYGMPLYSEITNFAIKIFLKIDIPNKKLIKISRKEILTYAGRYTTPTMLLDVKPQNNKLIIKLTDKGCFPAPKNKPTHQPPPLTAAFYDKDKIIALNAPYKDYITEFLRDKNGNITWLRLGSRAHTRKK